MSPYKKPLTRLGVTTLILTIAAVIVHRAFTQLYFPVVPVLILFFFLIYLVFVLLLVQKDIYETPACFINRFILLTGIKLFLLLAFILLYLIIVKKNNTLFLIYTLILYAVYSLVTYFSVLSGVKKNK